MYPTFESPFQPLNLLDPQQKEQVALVALEDSQPVGLVVALKQRDWKGWEIHSLYVLETYRRQHIGETLLKTLEKKLKKKTHLLLMTYSVADSPIMDPLLSKLNWESKRPYILTCFFNDMQLFHPKWFDREYFWPEDFELFFWTDLKPEEAQKIKDKCARKLIPKEVNPFQGDGSFEPKTSVGLRLKGEVVGWMVNRLIAPSVLCYFSFYMDPSLQAKGFGMQLLVNSIKLQQENKIKSAYFYMNILKSSMRWILTVRKRLIPEASKVVLYHQAWKIIES